jgi:hypothetical protein
MNDYKPRYRATGGEVLSLWQRTYNILDGKIHRLCQRAYDQTNNGHKRHVAYTIPDEAADMVKMLGELGPGTSRERCEEMVAYATSPDINQKIFGG